MVDHDLLRRGVKKPGVHRTARQFSSHVYTPEHAFTAVDGRLAYKCKQSVHDGHGLQSRQAPRVQSPTCALRAVARPGRRGFNDDDAKGRSPVSTDWKMTIKSTKMTANDSRIIIETYRQRCIDTRLVTNCRKISSKTNSFAENEQISATMFTINCLCVRSRDTSWLLAHFLNLSNNSTTLMAYRWNN